jgi:hypothetical protein
VAEGTFLPEWRCDVVLGCPKTLFRAYLASIVKHGKIVRESIVRNIRVQVMQFLKVFRSQTDGVCNSA